ncbi:MAG: glycerol-3-phosphate 1-O-acyltransferase PlsY [Clostridia bacterium]|nr:glycerol-3-phosphate 1-O-acyltransferase PlsY [Clostridia bacterium]
MIWGGFLVSGLYEFLAWNGGEYTPAPVLFIIFALVCIIVPYLLGSLNFAIIISHKKYKDDIRNHGSGNGGMTNMLRTYGKGTAALTLVLDMLKAVVSVVLGSVLLGICFGGYMAGFFCMLGHMFPIYYRFKGGKGVATVAAMILVLNPILFLILIFMFVVIVGGSKFISLGSVICVMFYPVLLHTLNEIQFDDLIAMGAKPGIDVIFAFLIAVMVVFMHRSNIKRLLSGTESKVSLGKKKENSDGDVNK